MPPAPECQAADVGIHRYGQNLVTFLLRPRTKIEEEVSPAVSRRDLVLECSHCARFGYSGGQNLAKIFAITRRVGDVTASSHPYLPAHVPRPLEPLPACSDLQCVASRPTPPYALIRRRNSLESL